MSIGLFAQTQTATYWAVSSLNNSGEPVFASPTTIKVRWEKRAEMFVDGQGNEKRSNAIVFLSQEVSTQDYLYLGTSTEADPRNQSGALEVKETSAIPNFAGSKFEYRVIV